MSATAAAAFADSPTATHSAAGSGPRTIAEALPIFVRYGSPRVLLAALATALAVRVWLGDWTWWDLAPIAGLAVYWPIQEWLIHVFILHFKPVTLFGREVDFRVPRKHRHHHREPWRIDILFIPFHTWLYSLPLLLLIWFGITPTPALAMTGVTAHLALALHYEWVHYMVHTRYWPRTALYQRLWRNHRLHHFKNEHYWYGVTMLSGDHLLRTAPAVQDVATSPTARTLLDAA